MAGKQTSSTEEYKTTGWHQLNFFKGLNKERLDILEERNKRYASDNNYKHNFEDVALIARTLGIEVDARQVAMILGILKLVRNANGIAAGESAQDRRDHIIDAVNYIDLAYLADISPDSVVALSKLFDPENTVPSADEEIKALEEDMDDVFPVTRRPKEAERFA